MPISINCKVILLLETARFSLIGDFFGPAIQISLKIINRLLHRKCDVRIFIHELQDFGKRTSERSERVSFPKSVATSE